MRVANTGLSAARNNKKDEFYTQLEDISNEVKYYREQFKDKVVLCNCDDPRVSNFFLYFALNFHILGLKKLISVCYKNNNPNMFSDNTAEKACYLEYNGEFQDDNMPDFSQIEVKPLRENGDFRSNEGVNFIKQADIICTNPPFSLFREYVSLLMRFNKQFLIIGNINAVTYKEIFPYIKDNKLWLGVSIHSGDRKFYVPDDYPLEAAGCGVDEHGKRFIRVKGVRWYTNLPHNKRNEELILYKQYNEQEYPKYDNYEAINVDKTNEIPVDYDGVMGVPITFLDKYSPNQFEICGIANSARWIGDIPCFTLLNGKKIYNRILIKKK